MTEKFRELVFQTAGIPAAIGSDVQLKRLIGSPELNMVDPFLLFDVFETDEPLDTLGGFPAHPYRGFEIATYVLKGKMRHKDNIGHAGVIVPGGVQWLTAGRGVVRSEMPEQIDGHMKGFQLWVNLPASEKMNVPSIQEFRPDEVKGEALPGEGYIHVIAGITNRGTEGAVKNTHTTPLFLDVTLQPNQDLVQFVAETHSCFVYMIIGDITIPMGSSCLEHGMLGIFDGGDTISVKAGEKGARLLIVAAKAIKEPVARGGPFVMNTREELIQAFHDYQNNRF